MELWLYYDNNDAVLILLLQIYVILHVLVVQVSTPSINEFPGSRVWILLPSKTSFLKSYDKIIVVWSKRNNL